ncbi:MAG: hypothetical protein ACJ77U_08360 [Chloroflexota bacterium]|jgi:hypothetical protein
MTDEQEADRTEVEPVAQPQEPGKGALTRVTRPALRRVKALGGLVTTATDPIVDRIGAAIDGVEQRIAERPGARVRRVRRMGAMPLTNLNDAHPDARRARHVQVGLRTIPVDEIAGTAIGGGDQRGGDFLPLKPFRGRNWAGRWLRLQQAQRDLAVLPPIEVVKYADRYWVTDGHNRVGLALYTGQPEIDATITELVPPGGRRTEPIVDLLPTLAGSRALRTAAEGHRPSEQLSHEDRVIGDINDGELSDGGEP